MPSSINFDNGAQLFNISLDGAGNLHFNANNTDGQGDTRVSIFDDNGNVAIGGGQGGVGATGGLQLLNASGVDTVFIGGEVATILLGGGTASAAGNPVDSVMQLGNAQGRTTIDMQGNVGNIRCTNLTETSDLRLKKGISPLLNALDKIVAMRGVCYQHKQRDSSKETFSEQSQVGFIGQEMESVCSEIVGTDAEGYKAINYIRLTPILVEAIKEQQQFIQRQAVALAEALEKIARIETAMKEQNA